MSRYLYKYQEPIPIEMLVKDVCNYKQQRRISSQR